MMIQESSIKNNPTPHQSMLCYLLFIILLLNNPLQAQSDSLRYPTMIHRGRLAVVAGAEGGLYVGAMSYLNFVWYKNEPRVPFEFYNDNKAYLQVDKLGHVYGSYLESYMGYKAMRWAGVSKKKALWYGATLGILLQSPIEVIDGFYEGWGFSWGDMAANTAGSAIVIAQELLFDGQPMKYKFSFSRSIYAPQANGYLGDHTLASQILHDYNGHTYWFSVGLNKIIPSKKIPDWLNVAFGYGANGMYGEFENIKRWGVTIPETQRYRQFLFSLDIDWTKIKTKNRFLKPLLQGMFMVKLPFPAIEINSKGQFIGHRMYY
jgi:uncharacterized protein YfiM (DUF2279 family)